MEFLIKLGLGTGTCLVPYTASSVTWARAWIEVCPSRTLSIRRKDYTTTLRAYKASWVNSLRHP
jgi:hypothetical protein